MAQSGQKWPKVAKSGPKWPKVAQSCPNWPKLAQSGPKLPKLAQSCPKRPRVAQTLIENLDGPKWPKVARHSPKILKVHYLGHPVQHVYCARKIWPHICDCHPQTRQHMYLCKMKTTFQGIAVHSIAFEGIATAAWRSLGIFRLPTCVHFSCKGSQDKISLR